MIDSNIPKRPTLLAAAGLAVALVLSFALNPTPAFAAPKVKCPDWPACKDDPGGEPGQSTCNAAYLGFPGEVVNGNVLGPCTDMDGNTCDLVRPTDTGPGWRFTEDCQTSDTLVITSPDHVINGEDHTLELVGPWMGGRAAITNANGHAVVQDLTIKAVGSSVADGSCNGSIENVEAAISFDPHNAGAGPPGTRVTGVTIIATFDDSGTRAQFCNAIELKSATTTDDNPVEFARVSGSDIGLNSYSNFGILVTNINFIDTDRQFHDVAISDNFVDFSANGCVAIRVGPWIERADIEDNDIDVPGCISTGGVGGVGISVLTTGVATVPDGAGPPGAVFASPGPANIVGNIVRTFDDPDNDDRMIDVGISIVDSAIGTNKGNTITGDDGDDPYCVTNSGDVPFPTKGKKKNTFNGALITSSSIRVCTP